MFNKLQQYRVNNINFVILIFFILLTGCIYEKQVQFSFDSKKMSIINKTKGSIIRLEIDKYSLSNSYVCSNKYSKNPKGEGLYEINLNGENSGYKRQNTTCLIEYGFIYKITGYGVHSVDTIEVKL